MHTRICTLANTFPEREGEGGTPENIPSRAVSFAMDVAISPNRFPFTSNALCLTCYNSCHNSMKKNSLITKWLAASLGMHPQPTSHVGLTRREELIDTCQTVLFQSAPCKLRHMLVLPNDIHPRTSRMWTGQAAVLKLTPLIMHKCGETVAHATVSLITGWISGF